MKNAADKVRAEFSHFKGKDLFSFRVYYQTDDESDDWRPTKTGITLRTDLIPELKEAVEKAYTQWKTKAQK
jgi:hypothetical protein